MVVRGISDMTFFFDIYNNISLLYIIDILYKKNNVANIFYQPNKI